MAKAPFRINHFKPEDVEELQRAVEILRFHGGSKHCMSKSPYLWYDEPHQAADLIESLLPLENNDG